MSTSQESMSLIDMTIMFCETIATLFEINPKYGLPNFLTYSVTSSKLKKTPIDLEILSESVHGMEYGFSERVFDYMRNRIIDLIKKTNSVGKRHLIHVFKKFFNEKNTQNKKKILITFSSLLPTYLIAHKTFQKWHKESCNELYFLKYIHFLAFEMLDPILLNIDVNGCKHNRVKLASTKKFLSKQ